MKADLFKAHVEDHGEAVAIYSFVSYATGTYVNSNWNAPDPESANYPVSGGAPGPIYSEVVSVTAMLQPSPADEFVRNEHGEEVKAAWRMYVPYDADIGHRDRVVIGGKGYWVAKLEEWRDAGSVVYRLAHLVDEVA